MNGFKLNSLTATGKTVSPVTVNFKNGLNLIIGPSDTGKTYIFESIDYLLGGSNPPKQINESKNHLTMYLEIENYSSNSVCTIARSLVNPTDDIIIYHSDIFGIDSAESTALHYESHKTKKNISTFLLEICNFQPPISTRVNTNYKKENFSFRSYVPYSMVSETKMISENSPIYHNTSYQDRTKYLYQFKFLVTNSDDSDVEEAIGKKMFDATKNSNLNLLDELLIQENEKREILLSKIVPDGDSKVKDISITTALLKSIQQNIAHLNTIISKLEIQRNKETSNIRYNQTVLKRFHLLKQQYMSDIERLQFIDEGSFLIDQLVVNKCPHCGKEIDSFHDKCDSLDYGMVSASCEYEISQIELKLSELDKSISTTLSVISEGKSRLIKIENDIRLNNKKLEDTLNPELDSLNKKMKEFSNIEKIKTELEQIDKKILQYNTLISDFKEKKHLKYSSPNQTALDIIKNTEFDKELCKTLNSFYYPKDEKLNIEFYMNKFKELDFAINEENRINFGKGSRALLASSFYIAVRNYCNKMNYPHSNFLILDSPINAFKDLMANEILDSSIKNKFIKYLSKELCNFQTIIMENLDISDIPNSIKNKIHIIEFTKSSKGRYGFF